MSGKSMLELDSDCLRTVVAASGFVQHLRQEEDIVAYVTRLRQTLDRVQAALDAFETKERGIPQAHMAAALVVELRNADAFGVDSSASVGWSESWGQPWTVLDALKHARARLAALGETDARIDAVLAGAAGVREGGK